MAYFRCKNCGTELRGDTQHCPACGARQKPAVSKSDRNHMILIASLLVICCVLGVALWLILTVTSGKNDSQAPGIASAEQEDRETDPPAGEDTPAPAVLTVECVLDYSKQAVDVQDPSKDFDWTQRVCLPRLVWDSAGAQALNDRIMEYSEYADTLMNGTEGAALYDITYQYNVTGSLAAIVLQFGYGMQYSEGYCDYIGFYFDAARDRELTRDEYIQALGEDPAALMEQAVAQRLEGEEMEISCLADDAVIYDGAFFSVELKVCYEVSGMTFSELVTVNRAGATISGWVDTVYGHSFYLPEGFEPVDSGRPSSGYGYAYYNRELDMRIEVWESTIYYLPFDSGADWIDSDYSYYETQDCVYLTRGDSYMVASGYYANGDIYYVREQFGGDYVVMYTITNGTEKQEECSELTGQFASDFQFAS